MRTLWITYNVFEPFYKIAKGKPTGSAPWTTPLFYSLFKEKNIVLGSIATIEEGQYEVKEIDEITYYSIPIKSGDNTKKLTRKLIDYYLQAINNFNPDIIHIHGVENNFGLIRKYINPNIPIVCSIQGLINPTHDFLTYSIANISMSKYKSLKNWLGRGSVKFTLKKWKEYISLEKEILQINKYFIGRTRWDKAHLYAFNPTSYYFHGDELLRSSFYNKSWSLSEKETYRIFVSSAAYPLKGFHVVLKAIHILKKKYPNITLVAPLTTLKLNSSKLRDILITEDYDNYLKREISRLQIAGNIILLPKLDAEQMASEYKKAHVFVLPSFLENSSNALGEAMLIGTPIVSAPVGGILSILKDEESGLFFPSGDYAMLAHQIQRILEDDDLAHKLSSRARSVAEYRHNVENTTQQYIDIYKDIIQINKKNG